MSDRKLSLLVNFIGIDKITGTMKNIVGLGRDGSKSIKTLTGEARKLEKQLAGAQKALAGSGGNVTDLINRERELQAALARTNAQLERQKRLAAIRADTAAMRRTADSYQQRGQANMLGGAGMAAPFILAGKAAMDFSSGMVDIQQKAELTNQETDRMAARILDLAKAAHQLPEDMRSGIDTLAGLGLDPRKAVEMIGPIGRLGTAFKVELADGANAAFANLNNLKVPISQTARALDIMAASGNAGAFEVKDMARWFPGLTAQMQALGQKGTPAVADLAAALQIARRGAGDADQAANNIQNLLSKIQSPETVKKFARFGIDLPNALKKAAREGKTPLETIAELTQKATGGDNARIGNLFEDMQAQGALRSLILNMDDFRKMRADIANSGGTVNRAFDQRAARDGTIAWRDFVGAMQALGITLGTQILPTATRFLTLANRMAGTIGAWAQAHPQLSAAMMNVAGSMVAGRIALGGLQFAFGTLLGPLASAIGWFRKAMVLGQIAGMLRSIAPLFAGISLPVLAVGAAVGVAAYLIYAHWDRIKAAFWGGAGMIRAAIGTLPAWMKSIGAMMMEGLITAINPALLAARLLQVARQGMAAFKAYFGIRSPSRLMMQMGGHITTGLARGVEAGSDGPARSLRRRATGVAAAGAITLAPIAPAAAAGAPLPGGSGAGGGITVNVYPAPGQSAQEIAQAVIDRLQRAQGIAARSSYDGGR